MPIEFLRNKETILMPMPLMLLYNVILLFIWRILVWLIGSYTPVKMISYKTCTFTYSCTYFTVRWVKWTYVFHAVLIWQMIDKKYIRWRYLSSTKNIVYNIFLALNFTFSLLENYADHVYTCFWMHRLSGCLVFWIYRVWFPVNHRFVASFKLSLCKWRLKGTAMKRW